MITARLHYRSTIRGVTLLEVLVALVILSIGLLGIARLQLALAKNQLGTTARTSLALLYSDMSYRIRSNPDASGDGVNTPSNYLFNTRDWNAQQAPIENPSRSCTNDVCSSTERAAFDLISWRSRVRQELPQGSAWIEGNKVNGIQISIMWFDKAFIKTNVLGGAQTSLDGNLALEQSTTCSANGSETGVAQSTCCPAAAINTSANKGVRCMRLFFIP